MENRKCPVLVGGKGCGLALILVAREIDSETEVYECPLGHRTEVPFGDLEKRKCAALANGKECGLPLSVVSGNSNPARKFTSAHSAIAPMCRSKQKL